MTSWKLGLVALLGLAAVTGFPAAADAEPPTQPAVVSFSIPAGALMDALGAFQDQAGLPPTGVGPQVMGRQTAGVSGNMPPREALERLLNGTELTFLERDDGGFMIEPLANVRVPGGRCVFDKRKQICREQ